MASFFILMLGCLGCRKKQGSRPQETQASPVNEAVDQARLSSLTDISLPLGLTNYQFKDTEVPGQHIIDYYSAFELSVIQDFYELDMERLGWRLLSKFVTGDRILLSFDKPQTWCIVLINSSVEMAGTASKASLFIGQKV